jgi:hypothetical protein
MVSQTRKGPEKKPLVDPKYKSFVNTLIFILILLIFFIVNNTRHEPESGPYPPMYNPGKVDTSVHK